MNSGEWFQLRSFTLKSWIIVHPHKTEFHIHQFFDNESKVKSKNTKNH